MSVSLLLAANAFSIVCAICGTFLAYHRREGWGWMYLFAALSAVGVTTLSRVAPLS